ncbi:MAG: glutathione peroxidase [Bacteroidetes bacterium]|nr:MAG: glutathione peroxidase [Bacteroidota bacterium]
MKYLIAFSLLYLGLFAPVQSQLSIMPNSLYDFTMETLDGQKQSLSVYKGKLILIVNTASRCGLTPQYEDLQALYEQYADQGLVILGFPANNFMNQEPGSNEDIAAFCQKNYGVSFPMFAKISVKGDDRHPLYGYLEAQTGEVPSWNFHKFLVHPNGEEIKSFAPRTRVTDADMQETIAAWLAAVEK